MIGWLMFIGPVEECRDFTIGKWYDPYAYIPAGGPYTHYLIRDDDTGESRNCKVEYFKTFEEVRNDKLNQLGI